MKLEQIGTAHNPDNLTNGQLMIGDNNDWRFLNEDEIPEPENQVHLTEAPLLANPKNDNKLEQWNGEAWDLSLSNHLQKSRTYRTRRPRS